MKYSLRSLMIVVTLICIVLGGRVGYLRAMAEHYRKESQRLGIKVQREGEGFDPDEFNLWGRSFALHEAYERAVYRPWEIATEPSP